MIALAETTRLELARHPGKPLLVGLSGGLDSSALLDTLAALPEARARGLRAVHVNHHLQPDAEQWARRCRTLCRERDISFTVLDVVVPTDDGSGPEAAARSARMGACAQHLRPDEALLLAHHRDDQTETILLKLLRGAGPHGLAGMRAWRPFAHGWLWRPWLQVPREQIRQHATARALAWVEDPSNRDPRMTRSWLRHEILPRIQTQLPQAQASIIHSGRLCAATRDYLDHRLDKLDDIVAADGSMDAARWLALAEALRGLQLERWLQRRGLPLPTTAQRRELERQAASADPDRTPRVHWRNTDVHIWRGRLHALRQLPAPPADWQADWDGGELALPLGVLRLSGPDGPMAVPLPMPLRVQLRRGGEYLHPAGDACGRELRYIFQRAALPPWLRPYCPLVWNGEQLLAVGGLCLTGAGKNYFDRYGASPQWRYHV